MNIGPTQATKMKGALTLACNLAITRKTLLAPTLPVKVCLLVPRTVGFLVMGLENGTLTLMTLVLPVMSLSTTAPAALKLGLFVATKGTNVPRPKVVATPPTDANLSALRDRRNASTVMV